MTSHSSSFFKCGRWDLNPHVYTDTRSLVLPVCQFQHSRSTCYNISHCFHFGNTFFYFFNFFLGAEAKTAAPIFPKRIPDNNTAKTAGQPVLFPASMFLHPQTPDRI